jgi:hypothetical protein
MKIREERCNKFTESEKKHMPYHNPFSNEALKNEKLDDKTIPKTVTLNNESIFNRSI